MPWEGKTAMKTVGWLLVAIAFVLTTGAEARTWRVEKDGSGDYAVIQDALDAAASGDTIRIGPGRFEDFREYQTNGGLQSVIAMVQVPVMTLIGSGSEQTIIGPADYIWDGGEPVPRGVLFIGQPNDGSLRVLSLTCENLYTGINAENTGPLEVGQCSFRGGWFGINSYVAANIDGSLFEDVYFGCMVRAPAAAAVVRNCHFSYAVSGQCVQFESVPNASVETSVFSACDSCNTVGVGYVGSGGTVLRNTFTSLLRPIYLVSAMWPEISQNSIETSGVGLYSDSEAFYAQENVFRVTGRYAAMRLYSRGLDHTISSNHILRGSGLAVEIVNHTGPADYHLDMTGNWWGTTDRDSIAAWIHDGNDVMWPPGGLVECTVDFDPIAEAPIPTEKKSLGGLKALFLGR